MKMNQQQIQDNTLCMPSMQLQRSYTLDKLRGPLSDQFLVREPRALHQAIQTRLSMYNESLQQQLQDAYSFNNLTLFKMKLFTIQQIFLNDKSLFVKLLTSLVLNDDERDQDRNTLIQALIQEQKHTLE